MDPIIPPDHHVDCLAGLEKFPGINLSAPAVKKFACMVDETLKPWLGIPGATSGLGSKGMIHSETLRIMSRQSHVRILHGCLSVWHLLLSDRHIQLPTFLALPLPSHDMLRRLSTNSKVHVDGATAS